MGSLWMLAASLLFAAMGVCVKLAAGTFAATELVFYRGAVSLVILGGYVAWRRLPLATKHGRIHFLRGLSGFVSLAAYFYAISLIPLATAVTLSYTSPLFLALLLVFWRREAVPRGLYFALVAGFTGIVLLLQPTLTQAQWLGGTLGLTSGIVSSVAYLNVRRLGEVGEPEWRTVFYFALWATLGGLPWFLAGGPLHAIDARGWWLLLGIGGFGTAAQLCMTAAYKQGRTLVSASLAFFTVIFSSIFGLLLWQESLPWLAWFGVALIVGGGIVAMGSYRGARAAPAAVD
jgi:drug/metabolite transporter (DMT)-like permease